MINYTYNLTNMGLPITTQTIKEIVPMPLWLYILFLIGIFMLLGVSIYEAIKEPKKEIGYLQGMLAITLLSFSILYNLIIGYMLTIAFAIIGLFNTRASE
ncbi:MAG: hypothetical protein ACP5LI_05950 [Hydrogenobaculum sp.]